MPNPFPPERAPGEDVYHEDQSVLVHLANDAPASMTGERNLARLVGATVGVPGDVNMQALGETFLKFDPTSDYMTDDALVYVGKERALPRYSGETRLANTNRINNGWNVWKTSGTAGFVAQLAASGYDCYVAHFIPGGGETPAETPTLRNAQRHVKEYPPTLNWWAQFIVVVTLSGPKVNPNSPMAVPWTDPTQVYSGASSVLLYQYELDTIRAIVDTFKPVGIICREIIAYVPPSPEVFHWDGPIPWDDSNAFWDQDDTSTSESFPGKNVNASTWSYLGGFL